MKKFKMTTQELNIQNILNHLSVPSESDGQELLLSERVILALELVWTGQIELDGSLKQLVEIEKP